MTASSRTDQPEPTAHRVVTYVGATPEYIRVVICPRCKSLVADQPTHWAALHADPSTRPTL